MFRQSRMKQFADTMELKPGTRIADLGGTTEIWKLVEIPLDITIVNLPGSRMVSDAPRHHRFTFVEGDATDLPQFPDNFFDVVFSNSVIEHVGGTEKERLFASEVRRLAPSYWVQTPSIWFPLEAHTGLPFWWFMPRALKNILHRRWERLVPAWNDMVKGTVVIGRRSLRSYFPCGSLGVERTFCIPKSYFIFRR